MIFQKENIIYLFLEKKKHSFLLLLLFLFFSTSIFAQQGGNNSNSNDPFNQNSNTRPNVSEGLQKVRKISKDSLLIFYYFIDNPNQEFPYRDTLLDKKFHQFDPARDRLLDYGSLGYLGSPLQPLIYQSNNRMGFDVGLHQYDLYKIHAEDLRFYNLKRAYSDFYFTQGASQDDIQLKARFSRNFKNNINVSMDYHRISQYGSDDPIAYFYQNQRARQTALAGGLAYHNDDKTYRGFFAFSNNIHQQEDNGGITSDTTFFNQEDGFISSLAIPVFLDDAETRHSEQEISYTQYYIFNPKQWKENKKRKTEAKIKAAAEAALRDSLQSIQKDSLALLPTDSLKVKTDSTAIQSVNSNENQPIISEKTNDKNILKNNSNSKPKLPPKLPPNSTPPPPKVEQEGRSYTFSHQFLYKKGTYKFSDITPLADADYWQNLLLDDRGLRHFFVFRKIENTLAVSTFKPRKNNGSKAQSQSDFFEIGLRHAFHWIDEEATDSTVNNLFLTGKWNFAPNERLKVETYAHLGLLDNGGDYRVSGNLFFDLKKIGQLQVSGVNQLYSPTALQQRFYISQKNAWTNDFKPTLETNISASYALPKFGFKATGKYHLLNNYIYFDTAALPQQEGAPLSIFQLIVEQNFKLRSFHFDNTIIFQQTTNDALNLPSIFSKHGIYYQGKWFKALNIRLGVDVRMNNTYFANTYNPLVGQFILQNKQKVKFLPAVDAYTSFKVKQFRFFVKGENLTRFLTELVGSIRADEQYYQIGSYPIQNGRFRMGLAWKFGN